MGQIRKLQASHRTWVNANFPLQLSHQPLLGLVEEVGELAHAQLKMEQGIRGSVEEQHAYKIDAIGDIFIYLMSYCNASGLDLEDIVIHTWEKVKRRDWQADPLHGGEAA
jgi:NTP pyrophosphatase (non-canonical NTP hydrolase)